MERFIMTIEQGCMIILVLTTIAYDLARLIIEHRKVKVLKNEV